MALTAKQEAFCLAVISGMSQSDAYRSAYDVRRMTARTIQKRASELVANGDVSGRITGLRVQVVQKVQYGIEQAMAEAREAFEVAKEKGNGGAMVAATQLRAKLNGLLIERREVRTGNLDEVPDGKLDEIIAAKAREVGMPLH